MIFLDGFFIFSAHVHTVPYKVQIAKLKLIAVQGSNPRLWLLLLISVIPQGTEFTKSP
jgi:hypothetical protein